MSASRQGVSGSTCNAAMALSASSSAVFRKLLSEFIQSDPSYSWFVSEYVDIPAVKVTDFWEDENASVSLSGIWTQEGQNKLHHWYENIKEAYGRDGL